MIGDVLTSSILFDALKKRYPSSELHFLINSHTLPVVENHPNIDKFQLLTPEIEASKVQFHRFLKSIQKEHYDVVIDVYGKLGSALISLYSKAKIRSAYYKKHTSFIYTHLTKRLKTPEHDASLAIENRLKLLECIAVPFDRYQPKIYLKEFEIEAAKNLLEHAQISLSQPLYMISVLGSSSLKTYPIPYLAKLLDELVALKPNAQLLFNYIPKQMAEAKSVYNHCSTETKNHIHFDVFGRSLREFLAITYHCDALLGNEGGANNMAKALDIPTFTIFSPYLNKKNWFGDIETIKHKAVHISDYIPYSDEDIDAAKKNPEKYYLKFKPEFIIPDLKSFLTSVE